MDGTTGEWKVKWGKYSKEVIPQRRQSILTTWQQAGLQVILGSPENKQELQKIDMLHYLLTKESKCWYKSKLLLLNKWENEMKPVSHIGHMCRLLHHKVWLTVRQTRWNSWRSWEGLATNIKKCRERLGLGAGEGRRALEPYVGLWKEQMYMDVKGNYASLW